MKIRLVLALLILCPTLLHAAGISLGPERPVNAPLPTTSEGRQQNAFIASSGSETLVTWIDWSAGRQGAYVAALDADGKLVPGTQRRLSGFASNVAISWNGQSYVVLWTSSEPAIYSLNLDRDRNAIAGARKVIASGSLASTIEWTASGGMFVYYDGLAYKGALVDRTGSVTRAAIAIEGSELTTARVYSDGQAYTVFTTALYIIGGLPAIDVFAQRYTAAGDARDAAPVRVASLGNGSGTWDAAFDGSRFALVFLEERDSGQTLRRYIVDPATLQTTILPGVDLPGHGAFGVRMEYDGSRFRSFWFDNSANSYALKTLSFTAAGAGDSAPVTGTSRTGNVDGFNGVWNGSSLMLVWSAAGELAIDEYDLYAGALATGAELSSASNFPLALSPAWQHQPAIATNGNESLLVWKEGRDPYPSRLVAAHATNGIIDGAQLYLSDNATSTPRVVFTGSVYLVIWPERTSSIPTITVRILEADGTIAAIPPIVLGSSYNVAAAFNGTHVLVAWPVGDGAQAVRFTIHGEQVDEIPIDLANVGVEAMASNGTDFLLVWTEENTVVLPIERGSDVTAARVSASGTLIGGRIPIASSGALQARPSVASDGRDYVIAYQEEDALVTKKLLAEGVLDGTAADAEGRLVGRATTGSVPHSSAIAYTGSDYVVAWELTVANNLGEVRLARVDRNGAVTFAPAVAARSTVWGMLPALAPGGGGTAQLAYARFQENDAWGGAMRVFIRNVGDGPIRGRAVRH
jgi:hypothetical protein